jgi:hypothetical protein
MAMKKRFYSVNGQMMGYEAGSVKKDFLTDHLDSITTQTASRKSRMWAEAFRPSSGMERTIYRFGVRRRVP